MTTNYNFSGPGAKSPQRGQLVTGHVYIWNPVPGHPPIANYQFRGAFIGECADGFMVKPEWRSDGSADKGTIFCRRLHVA